MKSRIYHLPEDPWPALRPDLTRSVGAWSLLPAGWSGERIAIATVAAGGEFFPHRDPYHHVFWFVSGEGELVLDGETHPVRPGLVAEIPAGTAHGYRNTGSTELVLLTINARDEGSK